MYEIVSISVLTHSITIPFSGVSYCCTKVCKWWKEIYEITFQWNSNLEAMLFENWSKLSTMNAVELNFGRIKQSWTTWYTYQASGLKTGRMLLTHVIIFKTNNHLLRVSKLPQVVISHLWNRGGPLSIKASFHDIFKRQLRE